MSVFFFSLADQVRMLLKYQRINSSLHFRFIISLLSSIGSPSFFFPSSEHQRSGARRQLSLLSLSVNACKNLLWCQANFTSMCEETFSLRNVVSLIPQSSRFACGYRLRFEVWLPQNENAKWLDLAQHCRRRVLGLSRTEARCFSVCSLHVLTSSFTKIVN